MKQLSALLVFVLCALFVTAQAPQKMNYQAAARDADGNVLRNTAIKVRISIRANNSAGDVEYSETRSVTTNQFGTFNIAIGSAGATYSTGALSDVKWSEGDKYMQVEIDPTNNNSFINLGSSQLLSVPYALYALESGDSTNKDLDAHNGVSISGTDKIQIGNDFGGTEAQLINDREIPLNRYTFRLRSQNSHTAFKDGKMFFQQAPGPGGEVFVINPIQQHDTQVPFQITRGSFPQNGGATTNNETANWGFNIAYGGGNQKPGIPGIGYSIESNYYPDAGSRRWVESHEFYLRPNGQQVRLKSYTIRTGTAADDDIDFYHTSDRLYVKSPDADNTTYFSVLNGRSNGNTEMHLSNKSNNLQVSIGGSTPDIVSFTAALPATQVIMTSFKGVQLPSFQSIKDNTGSYNLLKGSLILDKDNVYGIGDVGSRLSMVYTKAINTNRGFFGNVQSWGRQSASATLQVHGETIDATVPAMLVQNNYFQDLLISRNTGELAITNPSKTRSVYFNPNTSTNTGRVLEINSTETGILIPRMTHAQRNAVTSPKNGELIFNTEAAVPGETNTWGYFEYFHAPSGNWKKISTLAPVENLSTKDLAFSTSRSHTGNNNNLSFSNFGTLAYSASRLNMTAATGGLNVASDGVVTIAGKSFMNLNTTDGLYLGAQKSITFNETNGSYRFINVQKTPYVRTYDNVVISEAGQIHKAPGFYRQITAATTSGYLVADNDYTITLERTDVGQTLTLPDPRTCAGRILVLWNGNNGAGKWSLTQRVRLASGEIVTELPNGQTWQIQSNGGMWLKIN